jgi:hypothetical protein
MLVEFNCQNNPTASFVGLIDLIVLPGVAVLGALGIAILV